MPTLDDLTTYSNWSGLTRPYIVGNDNSGTGSTTFKFRAYDMFDDYLAHKMGSHYDSSTIPNLDSHICWLLFNDSQYAHDYPTPLVDKYLSNYSYLNAEAVSYADIVTSSYLSQCYIPLYYENTLYKCQVSDISGGGGGGGNFETDMEQYLFALPDYTDPVSGIADSSCCFFAMNKDGGYPSKLNFNNYVYNYFEGLVSISTSDLSDSDEIYLGGRYSDSSMMLKITLGELISYIQNH